MILCYKCVIFKSVSSITEPNKLEHLCINKEIEENK